MTSKTAKTNKNKQIKYRKIDKCKRPKATSNSNQK